MSESSKTSKSALNSNPEFEIYSQPELDLTQHDPPMLDEQSSNLHGSNVAGAQGTYAGEQDRLYSSPAGEADRVGAGFNSGFGAGEGEITEKQPAGKRSYLKYILIAVAIIVVLAVALGAGLGAGLKKNKSSNGSDASSATISSVSSTTSLSTTSSSTSTSTSLSASASASSSASASTSLSIQGKLATATEHIDAIATPPADDAYIDSYFCVPAKNVSVDPRFDNDDFGSDPYWTATVPTEDESTGFASYYWTDGSFAAKILTGYNDVSVGDTMLALYSQADLRPSTTYSLRTSFVVVLKTNYYESQDYDAVKILIGPGNNTADPTSTVLDLVLTQADIDNYDLNYTTITYETNFTTLESQSGGSRDSYSLVVLAIPTRQTTMFHTFTVFDPSDDTCSSPDPWVDLNALNTAVSTS
ncbi:uncharacterized protein V1516DRAFT_687435 [Lipomyces oligophaga]|uniref:uncharacterized protein n=1 Tax=Lipomyces oligophaga TaxID=45792 RepID=UPI0034CE12EB